MKKKKSCLINKLFLEIREKMLNNFQRKKKKIIQNYNESL